MMILTALLIGAAIITGIGIVAAFWNDIVDYFKRTIPKILETARSAVMGCKLFVRKIHDKFTQIFKYYKKIDEDYFEETTRTRRISKSQVPRDVLDQMENTNQEVDCTDKLLAQLRT